MQYESDTQVLEQQISRLQSSLRTQVSNYNSFQRNWCQRIHRLRVTIQYRRKIVKTSLPPSICTSDSTGSQPRSVSPVSTPSHKRKTCGRLTTTKPKAISSYKALSTHFRELVPAVFRQGRGKNRLRTNCMNLFTQLRVRRQCPGPRSTLGRADALTVLSDFC